MTKDEAGSTEPDSHFIIYYLNYPKTVELAMTFGSTIKTGRNVERLLESSDDVEGSMHANAGIGGSLLPKAELSSGVSGKLAETESYKVAETYQVKHTKSTYLKAVMKYAQVIDGQSCVQSLGEGRLVRVDHVKLSMIHTDELVQLGMLRHDALKGVHVEGIDINNLISTVLEDYSYVLVADMETNSTNPNQTFRLAVKIPSESSNEFESKYRIHDLLLGEVSLVGVYKGKVSLRTLTTSTYALLQNEPETKSESHSPVFKSSEYREKPVAAAIGDDPLLHGSVHYIDLLAIVQPIVMNSYEDKSDYGNEGSKSIKGFFARMKRRFHRG